MSGSSFFVDARQMEALIRAIRVSKGTEDKLHLTDEELGLLVTPTPAADYMAHRRRVAQLARCYPCQQRSIKLGIFTQEDLRDLA